MGDEMFMTLQAVRKLRQATPEQVAKKIDWEGSPTAINNRLAFLFRNFLLTRKKVGREWIYRLP